MRHTTQWWRRKRQPPATPAAPRVTAATASSISLGWDWIAGAASYELQRSLEQATWATVYNNTGLSLTDTPLAAATPYYYRLRATGTGGDKSAWSPVTATATTVQPNPPATPDPPTVLEVTDTTVHLAGTAVPNAATYTWQRSLTGTSNWVTIHSGPELDYLDTGQAGDTDYYYRWRAENSDGASAFSAATLAHTAATAQPPTTPTTAPTASGVDANSAILSWPAQAGATGYTLQRSLTGTSGWTTIYNASGTQFTNTGLSPATRYYYRYSVTNPAGTSGYSPVREILTNDVTSAGNVQPFSAQRLRSMAGVDVHPNFPGVYDTANADEVIAAVVRTGATYVRGMIVPGAAQTDAYAAALRRHGLKWVMTIAPTNSNPTVAETQAKIAKVNADYADLCIAMEGLNEPNASGRADWAQWTVDIQRAIWNACKNSTNLKNVTIIGASLHQKVVTDTNGQQYFTLKDLGILAYQDVCGLHAYPLGKKPDTDMQRRIDYIWNAYGANYPIQMTEFGYTTTATAVSGNTTTKKAMGIYGPRAYLQLCVRRKIPMSWYEVMDDPDSTGNDIQAHYGMVNTPGTSPSTWTDKPVVASVGALLNGIKDPVGTAPYTPAKVTVEVTTGTADVEWLVTATKAQSDAGTATVWIYRDVNVATGVTDLTVSPVSVTVKDRVGSRQFSVGPEVMRVDLR